MKRLRNTVGYGLFLVVLVFAVAGCGQGPVPLPTPEPSPTIRLDVRPGTEVRVGEDVAIVVQSQPVKKLEPVWSVDGTAGGTLNKTTGEQVIYTAGRCEGTDIVIVEGTTESGAAFK